MFHIYTGMAGAGKTWEPKNKHDKFWHAVPTHNQVKYFEENDGNDEHTYSTHHQLFEHRGLKILGLYEAAFYILMGVLVLDELLQSTVPPKFIMMLIDLLYTIRNDMEIYICCSEAQTGKYKEELWPYLLKYKDMPDVDWKEFTETHRAATEEGKRQFELFNDYGLGKDVDVSKILKDSIVPFSVQYIKDWLTNGGMIINANNEVEIIVHGLVCKGVFDDVVVPAGATADGPVCCANQALPMRSPYNRHRQFVSIEKIQGITYSKGLILVSGDPNRILRDRMNTAWSRSQYPEENRIMIVDVSVFNCVIERTIRAPLTDEAYEKYVYEEDEFLLVKPELASELKAELKEANMRLAKHGARFDTSTLNYKGRKIMFKKPEIRAKPAMSSNKAMNYFVFTSAYPKEMLRLYNEFTIKGAEIVRGDKDLLCNYSIDLNNAYPRIISKYGLPFGPTLSFSEFEGSVKINLVKCKWLIEGYGISFGDDHLNWPDVDSVECVAYVGMCPDKNQAYEFIDKLLALTPHRRNLLLKCIHWGHFNSGIRLCQDGQYRVADKYRLMNLNLLFIKSKLATEVFKLVSILNMDMESVDIHTDEIRFFIESENRKEMINRLYDLREDLMFMKGGWINNVTNYKHEKKTNDKETRNIKVPYDFMWDPGSAKIIADSKQKRKFYDFAGDGFIIRENLTEVEKVEEIEKEERSYLISDKFGVLDMADIENCNITDDDLGIKIQTTNDPVFIHTEDGWDVQERTVKE